MCSLSPQSKLIAITADISDPFPIRDFAVSSSPHVFTMMCLGCCHAVSNRFRDFDIVFVALLVKQWTSFLDPKYSRHIITNMPSVTAASQPPFLYSA